MTTVGTAIGGFIIYYLFIMNPLENVFYRMMTGDKYDDTISKDLIENLKGFEYEYGVTTYEDVIRQFGKKYYLHHTLRVVAKFNNNNNTYYYDKVVIYEFYKIAVTSNVKFTMYKKSIEIFAKFFFYENKLILFLVEDRNNSLKEKYDTDKMKDQDSFCLSMHYRWFTLVDSSAVISNCDFFKNRKAYWSDPELDWRKYFTSKRSLAPAYVCNGKFINTCWFWRWLDSPDEAADPYGTYKVKKPIAIADLDLEWNQINSLRKNE
ncbi:MAG: hypothetical protein SFU98_12220 [Leptospiraceae bacterium]|nr:hypothetical protein [Leptospiraceae bacterium]